MGENYNILITKLDEFIRKYYKNLLIRGGIYFVGVSLAFYLTVITLEYFGHFGYTTRAVLFYSWVVGTLYILGRLVAIPASKLYKLGKVISHEQASDIIGNHFVDVRDKLLNTLQLYETYSKSGKDTGLLAASIDQKIKDLRPIPFSAAIDLKDNRRYLKYAVVPLLIIFALLFSAPDFIQQGTARIVNHNTHFEIEAPFKFNIINKDLKVVKQEDFELQVKLTGDEIPANVMISIDGNEYRLTKDNNIEFRHLFRNVQEDTEFKLSADGFDSQEFTLNAVPNPIVLNFFVNLEYPKYIGKPKIRLDNTGDLIIPMGTKVKWTFNTKDTRSIRMGFRDTSFLASILGENNFSFNKQFTKSTSYEINTHNEFVETREPIQYAINVIPDLFPNISVEQFKDSTSLKRFFFRGSVKDDYGFNRLTFNYRYIKEGEKSALQSKELGVSRNSTQDQFYHAWDLNEIDLNPGDKLEYYFEVWDNDGINGSKAARTEYLVFHTPTKSELSASSEKSNEVVKKEMQNAIVEAKMLQKDLDKLRKQLLQKDKPGWEDKKKMDDLLEKQKELIKKVQEIKQENEENLKNQEEFSKSDQDLMEKNEEIRQLFSELMNEDMKEMFEEIQKLLDQMDKTKLQETLEEIKMSSEDMEKELDRTLELFKQMEYETKMQETIDKLNELAEEQEKLSEESEDKKSDANELNKKQEDIKKEFEEVEKNIDGLEKKNEELENPNKMENTEQEQKDVKQNMDQSSEDLKKNDKKKAGQSQKNAAQQMKKMAEKMESAMKSGEMKSNAEDYQTLRNLLENLVKLSLDQEELIRQVQELKPRDPKFAKLNQQQKKLQDDTKMIEDSLFALSKRQSQISSIVNKEVAAIRNNMGKAIESLADRQSLQNARDASTRQQWAMTSMNNLALILDESLRKMQQQMSSQMSGSQMCNKPGSGKPGKGKKPGSMSEIKKLQQQLNQRMKDLKDGKGGQGGKGGKGENGKSGMSKGLAKLAAEQEAIRQHLNRLNNELNKDGKGSLGDLDKLQKMMEETETDLVNKNISAETIKRQNEIMTRLLEAEKAERTRGEEEKRESKEAKNEDFSNPEDFFEYNRLKLKEVELLKTVPPSLNSYYKKRVNDYFNNFQD